MSILIVVLILFGSFSHSLSTVGKCRFDKIYKEVLRFCKGSDYPGCSNDLSNFNTFLDFFQKRTDFFCQLPRIKDKCKSCSLNVSGTGNGSNATGSGTNAAGNGTNTAGNGTATTP